MVGEPAGCSLNSLVVLKGGLHRSRRSQDGELILFYRV